MNPEPLPEGWQLSFKISEVARKATIKINYRRNTADISMDRNIFENPDVPEGCKIFILFHEIGHLIYGPSEESCDEFAFWHSLRAGVSPFLCYVAIRAYLPERFEYRIQRLGTLLIDNPYLKKISDENPGFSV